MKNPIFTDDGKQWYLIPELPIEQHNLHLPVEIEKAKANALPIVNPKLIWELDEPVINHVPVKGELYEWPGTWERQTLQKEGSKLEGYFAAKLIAPQQPQAEKTDNELIAEFMGFTAKEMHNLHGLVYSHLDLMGVYGDKAQEFKYHKSWDWLMPVAQVCNEKCKETGYPDGLELPQWHLIAVASNIKLVYFSVVEFIKWYNTQPKQL